MKRKIFTIVFLFLMITPVIAQRFDIYYICVGSADYESDFTRYEKGFVGFSNLEAGRTSPVVMAAIFDSCNAVYGKKLISTDDTFITRKQVLSTVKDVIKKAQQDRKKKKNKPLIIFYFCGHGLSEGLGWNLFMIPGDFTHKISNLKLEKMRRKSIYTGDIYDILSKDSTLPFMMLLDCCYEGDEEKININDYSYQKELEQMAGLTSDGMEILRFFNQYHENNSVIFSTHPGKIVEALPHPFDSKLRHVGPICYRALLFVQSHSSFTWSDWVKALTMEDINSKTSCVSFWEGNREQDYYLKQ